MSDTDPQPVAPSVHDILNRATAEFHRLRGDAVPDRAEQWESHVATLHMVADHTQEALDNAQEAPSG